MGDIKTEAAKRPIYFTAAEQQEIDDAALRASQGAGPMAVADAVVGILARRSGSAPWLAPAEKRRRPMTFWEKVTYPVALFIAITIGVMIFGAVVDWVFAATSFREFVICLVCALGFTTWVCWNGSWTVGE